jgi:hypothetical protein
MRQHTPDVKEQMSDVRTSTAALTRMCCSQRESYSYEHTRSSMPGDRNQEPGRLAAPTPSRHRRPVQHPTSTPRRPLRERPAPRRLPKPSSQCPRTRDRGQVPETRTCNRLNKIA